MYVVVFGLTGLF